MNRLRFYQVRADDDGFAQEWADAVEQRIEVFEDELQRRGPLAIETGPAHLLGLSAGVLDARTAGAAREVEQQPGSDAP